MSFKKQLKHILISTGLWYPLTLARKAPETLKWLRSGFSGVAPQPLKMKVVAYYLKAHSINVFIETGTYHGDTLNYIARSGVKCISIELSQEYYQAACKRFETYNNVSLVHGDSGQRLPELLKDITQPVCFWLDGHYSYGMTAGAETHTPISTELKAILSHPVKQHVILIDDARCFDGTNNYPLLEDLLKEIRKDGNYRAEVSTDIIRLVPCVKQFIS